MKKLLPLLLTILALNAYGQEWTKVKVDDLTITIPDDFVAFDTLGVHTLSVEIDNAIIIVQRIVYTGDVPAVIPTKDDLQAEYKEFMLGMLEEGGTGVSQQFDKIGGLEVFRFVWSVPIGEAKDSKEIRHCVVACLNDYWYAVHFWELEVMSDQLKGDRDKLFSSIQFPAGMTLKNQLTKP